MAPKFDDLRAFPISQLREELAGLKRAQLQAIAKKCGLKANQRTLELTSEITEYFIKQRNSDELDIDGDGVYPRRPSDGPVGITAATIHKTPFNPVFNPRYAPTDTKKAAEILQTNGSLAPSSSKKAWLDDRSKDLAELEAALKTLPNKHSKHTFNSSSRLPSTSRQRLTGTKRKGGPDHHVAITSTPSESLVLPAKRIGVTPSNTLELKQCIIRRPGRVSKKPALGPSRFGPRCSNTVADSNHHESPEPLQQRQQQLLMSPTVAHKVSSSTTLQMGTDQENCIDVNNKTTLNPKTAMHAYTSPARLPTRKQLQCNTPFLPSSAARRANKATQAFVERMKRGSSMKKQTSSFNTTVRVS